MGEEPREPSDGAPLESAARRRAIAPCRGSGGEICGAVLALSLFFCFLLAPPATASSPPAPHPPFPPHTFPGEQRARSKPLAWISGQALSVGPWLLKGARPLCKSLLQHSLQRGSSLLPPWHLSPPQCVASLAVVSLGARWYMSSAEDVGRHRYMRMPSVVGWYQPSCFMQQGVRTMVLEASVGDGPAFAGIGLNRTEFDLFIAMRHRAGSSPLPWVQEAEALVDDEGLPGMVSPPPAPREPTPRITERFVDLSVASVRDELRGAWEAGRLLMKNKSYRSTLDNSPSMGRDLVGYLKRRRQLDEEDMNAAALLEWIRESYGQEETDKCMFDASRDIGQTKEAMLPVLHWFRDQYPYYHQKCLKCGHDDTTSLGTVRAGAEGDEGLATTRSIENFHCPSCNHYTRFPRFSSLQRIIESGRGRCGEYSCLWYALGQALGYETRWVVDWEDHVWIEVKVQGQWCHIDPCEAAFEDKLMYCGWGKKHTYVVAFSREGVEDVTSDYCEDMDACRDRRDLTDHQFEKELDKARSALMGESV